MKVLILSLLLAAVVSVHAGDKEMYMLKKWAMHKACESCFGEANTKKMMIKMKKAYAKCSGMPAPELGLPIFKAPHRVAGALVHSAHHGHGSNYHSDDWIDQAMKKYFLKKMFSTMMKEMDDDDDMDMDDMDMAASGPMRFFKAVQKRRRFSRDVSKDMLDLGEKLTEKLEMEEMKMEAKIGNMTCMLQECGILTPKNELADVEDMISMVNEEFEFPDKWLASNIEKDLRKCHMFATSVPDEFFEDCNYPVYIGRVKLFKMCKKISKLRTCMNYDIKNKLENNFAPLEDLVKETGLEENELLPLVMKMLHGKEMEM